MPKYTYEEYREFFEKAGSAEEKLSALYIESCPHTSAIKGYAHLIEKYVAERGAQQMPPDFPDWCQRLSEVAQTLDDLMDAALAKEHREVRRAKEEETRRAQAEQLWRSIQHEFEALQDYENLMEAIKGYWVKNQLPLPQTVNTHYLDFVASAIFETDRHSAVVDVRDKASKKSWPIGYLVTVWEHERNGLKPTSPRYEGIAVSLDEVVLALQAWLVEQVTFEQLGQRYEWMRSGVVHFGPYNPLFDDQESK